MALQNIVSRDEWLAARKRLLAKEKEFTKARDALNAERRTLPMVEIDKDYVFTGPKGKLSLLDLFDGRHQLIVYHFMFDPDGPPEGKSGSPWEEGCPGCSHIADNIPHLAHMHARDTSLVMVSRAPMEKIVPFKRRMGWTMPWVSSFGSDFNYDFHVTLDASKGSDEYNYMNSDELVKDGFEKGWKGELPGVSVFLRDGDRVFHSYSTYARGLDPLLSTLQFLDLTPFGRGEGWDGMPDIGGKGKMWLRHHDKYDEEAAKPECCHGEDEPKARVARG
jgi:predicted dithiol-disulfide oxidoreductase (DUF899 family)